MVIRLLLVLIFVLIGFFRCKRNIIIEKEKNPKLKKDGKVNFLTSSVPFTIFLVFILYVVTLVLSVLLLQSQCTERVLLREYAITGYDDEYEANDLKNQTYFFDNNGETVKILNIDKLEIDNDGEKDPHIAIYQLKSDNNIVNFLLYGANERELIIYD